MRAKFRLTEIKKTADYGEITTFMAASGPTNKTWSKWTPLGALTIQITNPQALEQFKLGEHYFLDITPAPATEEEEAGVSPVGDLSR